MAFETQLCDSEEAVGVPTARIFVALRVSPEIAKELMQMASVLEGLSVRIIGPADIHLTLVPPWNETAISKAVEKLRSVAEKATPFPLAFRHLGYGPQPRRPRLLWADCEASNELAALHAALLLAFGKTGNRAFLPHVTVARIRGNGDVLMRKHPIDRALAFSQRVETVELMQSPPAGEIGYRVLASLPLGGNSRC